jgi:hypothetical protein
MKKTVMMVLILLGAVTLLGNNYALAKGPHSNMKGGQYFDAIDTDKDGKISKEEHMAKHEERFNAMDTDNDGFLTKEEHRKAWEKHKGAMKEKMQEGRSQGQSGTSPTDVSPQKSKKKSY